MEALTLGSYDFTIIGDFNMHHDEGAIARARIAGIVDSWDEDFWNEQALHRGGTRKGKGRRIDYAVSSRTTRATTRQQVEVPFSDHDMLIYGVAWDWREEVRVAPRRVRLAKAGDDEPMQDALFDAELAQYASSVGEDLNEWWSRLSDVAERLLHEGEGEPGEHRRSQSWTPVPRREGHRTALGHEGVRLRRFRRIARRVHELRRRPQDFRLRRRISAAMQGIDEFEHIPRWCMDLGSADVDDIVRKQEERDSDERRRQWRQRMNEETRAQREWVRRGADAQVKRIQDREGAPSINQDIPIHSNDRLRAATMTWMQVWGSVHPAEAEGNDVEAEVDSWDEIWEEGCDYSAGDVDITITDAPQSCWGRRLDHGIVGAPPAGVVGAFGTVVGCMHCPRRFARQMVRGQSNLVGQG